MECQYQTAAINNFGPSCAVCVTSTVTCFLLVYTRAQQNHHYLEEFVDELKQLEDHGLVIDGQHKTDGFVMDAPATASVSVLYIYSFNSFFGCRKCWAKGLFNKKMTFPEVCSDQEFRDKTCDGHHNGTSVLEKLSIDMIDDIPLDPKHLLYLGVVKKIIDQWIDSKRDNLKKLSRIAINIVNTALDRISNVYPREFQRKPRRIDHYKKWKATEFRAFLLYSGPLVMKDVLSPNVYKHFMYLSTASRILSSSEYLTINQSAN